MKVSNELVQLQLSLDKSITCSDYTLIVELLNEAMTAPLWSEQVIMTVYLNKHVVGALFHFEPTDGWCYVMEGA